MNIYPSYTAVLETFNFPAAPDSGTVTAECHFEWGDEVDCSIAAVDTDTWTLSISATNVNAAGVYFITWSCEISTIPQTFYSEFIVEDQYVLESDFMSKYELFDIVEFQGNKYDIAEKNSRRLIDTICGQNFQSIFNKTLTFDCNGKEQLYTSERLDSITEVTLITGTGESDITSLVELDPRSHLWIKFKQASDIDEYMTVRKFPIGSKISVRGNWGWRYVPRNIVDAMELFIVDMLDETRRENKRYGISRQWQDTNRLEFSAKVFGGSTGNADIDVLLMDYILWIPDIL